MMPPALYHGIDLVFDFVMNVNSTTVLNYLKDLRSRQKEVDIDIHVLASALDLHITALISILTELEHRDEVILNISTTPGGLKNGLQYQGTVRLMDDVA
jgi:hypothetical protein